jgi:hypothetical protein
VRALRCLVGESLRADATDVRTDEMEWIRVDGRLTAAERNAAVDELVRRVRALRAPAALAGRGGRFGADGGRFGLTLRSMVSAAQLERVRTALAPD